MIIKGDINVHMRCLGFYLSSNPVLVFRGIVRSIPLSEH